MSPSLFDLMRRSVILKSKQRRERARATIINQMGLGFYDVLSKPDKISGQDFFFFELFEIGIE